MSSSSRTHRSNSGYFFALGASLVWSTTGVLLRYIMNTSHIAPLALAAWRDILIAFILLVGLSILRRDDLRVSRRNLIFLASYGVIGIGFYHSLWVFSIAQNGAAVATVLNFTSPAFVVVAARWLFKEAFTRNKAVSLVMTLIGCVLVSGAYDPLVWALNPAGLVAGIGTGIGFAVYSLFGRSAARRAIPPWTTLTYSFSFAALALILMLLVTGATPRSVGTRAYAWGVLLLLAWGPTLSGFILYNASLARVPSSVASLIIALEPVFVSIIAYLWLREQMTPLQLAGAALILGAVLLLRE